MSINVYLRGNEVQKLEGFTVKQMREKGRDWESYELPGIQLHREKGRWYVILHNPTEPVPAEVVDIVDEISLLEFVIMCSPREAGIYRHESAEAEVEPKTFPMNHYWVHIRAKKMEDLLELFREIKIGSIRPERSYEGPQSGKSRSEICSDFEGLKNDLSAFRWGLKGWPFCTKKRVRGVISTLLNKYFI